jgi:sulfur-oxidizing protein SoxY
MQMDQVTRLYTPAWYVERLDVQQGGKPLFSMDGGISLSEDPTFRFSYEPGGGEVDVQATDTEGNRFHESFAAQGS